MRPGLRRLLTFLAMVATGLALVWVLQEEKAPLRTLAYGSGGDRGDEAVGLVHKATDTQVEVTVGQLDFDVPREVEVAPGVFASRPAYRVRVLEARPAPDGAFLVTRPTITFLDLHTGAVRGELTAEKGRFETEQAVGGKLRLDIGDIRAERFSLTGEVRGTMPLQGGGPAHLEAERLDVDGADVTAPGPVRWHRDDLVVTGVDMRWDDASGQISYARDAELTMVEPETARQAVLRAAGGLLWHLPADDADGHGWGELFGPVTGEASDGSRLAADTLLVAADSRALTLRGAARLEAPRGGRHWRVTAPHITVARTEDGGLALGQADGGVRIEDAADASTWLEAGQLIGTGDHLQAPGPVTFAHAGLTTSGHDLRWEEATGRVELLGETLVQGTEAAPAALVGGRLHAAGGLEWLLPASGTEAGLGLLRGPVTGTLVDGSTLDCDELTWDGDGRRATLAGNARVRRPGPDATDALSADRMEVTLGDGGGLAALLCTRDVRVVRTPVDGPASSLSTARLEVLGDLLLAPGEVRIEHGAWRVTGRDLGYDDRSGRFELAREASMVLADEGGGDALRLDSDLGFTWWLPEDRTLGAAAGHGELAGPVRGRTADGGTLWADRATVTGEPRGIELFGSADIVWPGQGRLASDHLHVVSGPRGLAVTSREHVVWARGSLEGEGRGMALDEAAGTLAFEQDVELVFRDAAGAFQMAVGCSGPLEWWSPPGSQAPLLEGHGECSGDVVGRDAAGGGFTTERLVIDGPAGRVELQGPSRVESVPLGASLAAADGIQLERGPDGQLRRLEARGSVTGRRLVGADDFELQGDALVVDRLEGRATVSGGARVVRRRGDEVLELATEPEGSLVAVTEGDDQLSSVSVEGRVTIVTADIRGVSDSATWDVAADHVVLEGDCRFLGIGSWLTAPRVEVWPEAGRWFVPRSVIVVDNARR